MGVALAQDVCLMQGGMQIDEYKIGGQTKCKLKVQEGIVTVNEKNLWQL